MIAYLKGKNIAFGGNYLILDVNNIGYKVYVAEKNIPKLGETVSLYTYNHIREDCSDLYGFERFNELELFEKLITVNGVGPKAALNILSSYMYEEIIQGIINENVLFFQSISGIGKKVATKIILELKSKISGIEAGELLSGNTEETLEALSVLGYKTNEIMKVIPHIPENLISSEDRVRWCLKNLSK